MVSSPFLDLLVKQKHITEEQATEIYDYSQNHEVAITQALVESGIAGDPSKILEVAATGLGMDFVHLADLDFSKDIVNRLGQSQAIRFPALPLYEKNGSLYIATPIELVKSVQVKDDLRRLTKSTFVTLVATTRKELLAAIDSVFRADEQIDNISTAVEQTAFEALDIDTTIVPDEIEEESKVQQFVDLILNQGIRDRASDIHFDAEVGGYQIRIRIDNKLTNLTVAPRVMMPQISARIKIMANLDPSIRRQPQDGRLSVRTADGKEMNLRVATLPTVFGEKIVLRVLDNSAASLSLEELGFSDENLEAFKKASHKPYGMILVTGPTGSGKSTTLYSALNTIKNPTINIITVEDPVEYQLPGIGQVPVNKEQGLTFERVLRTVLRADPDVILVGEIRDPETAKIAMDAGMTGHLVFSTLHTNDAASAVTRLGEIGVEPYVTATTVEAVVAQRLVRRLCVKCKVPYTLTEAELNSINFPWDGVNPPKLFRPVGCKNCNNTGYRGRMGIHEVLTLTDTIKTAIIDGEKAIKINQMAIEEGMVSLRLDGMKKVAAGFTTVEEILGATGAAA